MDTSPLREMAGNLLTSLAWSQKDTDFTVLFATTDRTLSCHKSVLAQNSPVLKTMLNLDCKESSTNQMTMVDFDYDTTVKFLSCLYSDFNTKTRRSRARLTPKVLQMAHLYQVKKLQEDCVECLKGNIGKDTVVDVWMVAEIIEDESLREAAFMYFFDHPKDENLLDIPGMNEACVSSLVDFLLCHADLAKMVTMKHARDLVSRSEEKVSKAVADFQDWLRSLNAWPQDLAQDHVDSHGTTIPINTEPVTPDTQMSLVNTLTSDINQEKAL